MSTSLGFVELTDSDVAHALGDVLIPRLKEIVTSRTNGHCMRITHLDVELMIALCRELRRECSNAQIYILKGNGAIAQDERAQELFISSTKLVELRNPLPDGTLRSPLLIFLPPNLRTSAEDSFGVATFEDIPVTDVYETVKEQLLQRVPTPLQGYVQELLAIPSDAWWPWADQIAQVRFLLTAIKNQVDGESLGASLYELGLVPDFRLFGDPALMQNRLRRNLDSVRKLTYSDSSARGRVLDLGLSDRTVQRRLIQFLSEVGVVDPHIWTRQIVLDKSNRDLSFDKWKFIDEISSDKVSIEIIPDSITIPIAGENDIDESLEGLSGQRILNPNKQAKFSLTFKVDPHPSHVPSLDHFSVQIMTKNGEPVGGAKRVKAWTSKKSEQTVHLDKLNKLDFEDGWHFVRILPWTKDDVLVPLSDSRLDVNDERMKLHESEPFYVLREGEIVDAPQKVIPQEHSLEHARLYLQFKALSEEHDPQKVKPVHVEWVNKGSKTRHAQQEMLEVRFESAGKFHIPVSRYLKTLEQQILASPESPVCWYWHINLGMSEIELPVAAAAQWPRSAAVESFLDARGRYFATLRESQDKELITQAVDLLLLKESCIEYAEAYLDLLEDLSWKVEQSRATDQQKAILELRTALTLDTIHITLTDFRGRSREASLVGPTHPLRALWFSTWAQVAQHWLTATREGPEEYIAPVRDGVMRGLLSLNVPATLVCADGRVFTTVDNVNPFWSLYAPPTEEDTRGLLGEICALLGLPEPAIGGETITAEVLAARMSRYLAQHPYIRTLSINAFNPGRASVLAQALVLLQKQEPFSQLRYDVRLFVPDPATPQVGEAIELLLSPGMTVSTEAADAFSLSSGSHLFPKLSLAIHGLYAFNNSPQSYRAHLSMLFDLFPAEEIGAGLAFRATDMTPLYGLAQDFITDFQDNEDGTSWRRQPRHGRAHPLPGVEGSIDLLADLSRIISGMVATVATGVAAFDQRPILTLSLSTAQRELIHYVHEVSDWVMTIDRNIGIEFFDHGGRLDRPDYLIDYTPGSSAGFGHQLIITSRALLELEATLKPMLQQHRLKASRHETTLILDQLRALSGRLALKLISSPTHQAEALGLALARLFLIHQGVLANQILLPLDVHLDLFHAAKRAADESSEAVTLQRTDLALFDLNSAARTIRCNLVEVKCYNYVGGPSAYAQLKETITEQINQSESVLRRHFDPNWKMPDRPDRLLKTRELTTHLEFYLGRSGRYGIIEKDVQAEALYLLSTLEDGYSLQFTRSALIFDFEQPGTESPQNEAGIEFYRIGKDIIEALITEARPVSAELVYQPTSVSESSTVPRLPSAAFIVPPRDRSVPWDQYKQVQNSETFSHTNIATPPTGYINEPPEQSLAVPDAAMAFEMRIDEQVFDERQEVAGNDIPGTQNAPEPVANIEQEQSTLPSYSVMLGAQGPTPQYGILGEVSARRAALDLNQTHTISLFGVQGSGKSYTLGSIIEMACLPIPHVSALPSPLATVIFHYSPTQDYKPEFTSMIYPNTDEGQRTQLRERYGAEPQTLQDIVLLVPTGKLAERRAEYPDIDVQPITFAASELKAVHWKFLMGAVGSQSMYLRQINLVMKRLRDKLTLEGLRQEVEHAPMSDHLKGLAQMRLQFASEYIDDSRKLSDIIRPGRLIIVDVRDEFIEKDEALGLFVVLLQIFSEAIYQGHTFNKLVVFDEAHKYIESSDLISGLIEVVREMRHKGTSIMVASQDPLSVPVSLIELSSQIILHRYNSPAWLKHIQKANSALNSLTPEKMSHLGAGEAYVWSAKATDEGFTRGAIKIKCRPRVTRHGGDTKTAVTPD